MSLIVCVHVCVRVCVYVYVDMFIAFVRVCNVFSGVRAMYMCSVCTGGCYLGNINGSMFGIHTFALSAQIICWKAFVV